jgi:hypothetical protein
MNQLPFFLSLNEKITGNIPEKPAKPLPSYPSETIVGFKTNM